MSLVGSVIVEFDPVETFKILVRNGYQQTAVKFWSENFTYAVVCDSSAALESGLSIVGEMSRWLRATAADDGNASAAVAHRIWISIVASGIEQYTALSEGPDDAERAEYRGKLSLAWDDPDGSLWADSIAVMNECLAEGLDLNQTFCA